MKEHKQAIWPEHEPWRLLWIGDDIYIETDIKCDPLPGRMAVKLCAADTKAINDAFREQAYAKPTAQMIKVAEEMTGFATSQRAAAAHDEGEKK